MTELDFPAVTICSQGLNMDNVAKAVERDFYEWHHQRSENARKTRRRSRRSQEPESLKKLMSIYLKEKFDIDEGDPGILDIIQSTSSVGGGAAVKSEDVTNSVKKCSADKETANDVVPTPVEEYFEEDHDQDQAVGNDCSIMNDYKLLSNNYSVIANISNSQQCVNHCYNINDCKG